jgi:hypothetical protein
MLKISRIKPGENNKICGISPPESNKIGLAFFWIFYNFLVHWTDLKENLDRVPHERVLKLTQSTLQRFPTKQLGPWPGRRRGSGQIPASRRRSRPGKRLGSARGSPRGVGCRSWGGRDGRRGGSTAAAAAAARGKWRGRQRRGQQANWGGSRVPSEATGALAQGGGGNGSGGAQDGAPGEWGGV